MFRLCKYAGIFFLLSVIGAAAIIAEDSSNVPVSQNAVPWLQRFTPARQYFVSPSGQGSGLSQSDPKSFSSAIQSARPGDLYWMAEGTYAGAFYLTRKGTAALPIVFRALPGKRVVIDGGLKITAPYNWIWGLEITDPAGKADFAGVEMLGQGIHLINNVIHDKLGDIGVGAWNVGPGQVVYGNIIYTQRAKSNNPHNLYAQNDFAKNGYKYIVNNMLLDAATVTSNTFNFHAYTQGGLITGFHVERNIVANGRFLIGGYNKPSDNHVVRENYFYNAAVRFGYARPTQARFQWNYLGRSPLIVDFFWGAGETVYRQLAPNVFTFNEIILPGTDHVTLRTSAFLTSERCDGCARIRPGDIFNENTYSNPFRGRFYADNANLGKINLTRWRAATAAAGKAFDLDSVQVPNPREAKIALLRNEYEPTRAHLVIFNWGKRPAVTVDLSSIISPGAQYAIYNPKATFSSPAFSGTYLGPISIPTAEQEFLTFLVIRR